MIAKCTGVTADWSVGPARVRLFSGLTLFSGASAVVFPATSASTTHWYDEWDRLMVLQFALNGWITYKDISKTALTVHGAYHI